MTSRKILAAFGVALAASAASAAHAQPMIGETRTFGFSFCPLGWGAADGSLLPISGNEALFALIGTTYGGDGQTTFALPDLRSRTIVHQGQGPGLSNYVIGQMAGAETVTLLTTQMPSHAHGVPAGGTPASISVPTASSGPLATVRGAGTPTQVQTTSAGGSQPHQNRQPYLAMRTCIALEGIFPSRN